MIVYINFFFSLNGVHWLFQIELHGTELRETDKLFQIHLFIYPFVYLKLIEALLHPDFELGAVIQL